MLPVPLFLIISTLFSDSGAVAVVLTKELFEVEKEEVTDLEKEDKQGG